MKEFLRRLRFFLHRADFERDLDEEMRHHLALAAEEHGSPMAAARRFGNAALLKEESRAMWTWTVCEQVAQDIRYAIRTMASNPLFTAMAALSLALGIGANTAIYSFLDAILLRPLPVPHPEQLVVLNWRAAHRPAVIHGQNGASRLDRAGISSRVYPFGVFHFLRANQQSLSSLFAFAIASELNVIAEGQADTADVQLVSGDFYPGLGLPAAAGRLIAEDDDRAGTPPVAVLSHRYWQRRFAADPNAIGQTILINNTPFTIVGVSAPGFFGLNPDADPELSVPLHSAPLLTPQPAEEGKRRFFDDNYYWLGICGRLRPGIGLSQAQASLAPQLRQFLESTASTPKEKAGLPALWLQDGAGGLDSLRHQYAQPLYVLMAMVGLILTIACANIANLLLARSAARRREIAVRLSLGAGRMRVLRQLLTETALLSLGGGALGLLVALWGIRTITWLLANGRLDFTLHATLNWSVLGFTLALTLVTGLLSGLAPAIRATKVDLAPALKQTRAGTQRTHGRLSRLLVASQIALSLLLVVAAGLFGRTLSNLQAIPLGFDKENLLLFHLNARQAGYQKLALAQFYSDLLDDFHRIPGVRSAALSQFPLAAGSWNETRVTISGPAPLDVVKPVTCYMPVDPGFFPTMQIPILMGRGLLPRDLSSPAVAVVNQQFVRKYFPGQNPLGSRIALGGSDKPPDIEIVGVAQTTVYQSVKEAGAPPVVYLPYTRDLTSLDRAHFELRTAGDPLAIVSLVRQAVHRAAPAVPLSEVTTQAARIDRTYSQERTFAWLCTCFAALALAIACVGLYGTMAYIVARRTNEIGIRMALGAGSRSVLAMVLKEVFALAAAGLTVGLAAVWATSKFVESFLFGIKHNDPWSIASSVLVLLSVACLAGFLPAWKASRIDPMNALRHD
jgi:predicted permease